MEGLLSNLSVFTIIQCFPFSDEEAGEMRLKPANERLIKYLALIQLQLNNYILDKTNLINWISVKDLTADTFLTVDSASFIG